MPKPSLTIEIRDIRIPNGGRLSISARTTSKVERRRREAALRALLDQGRVDIIEAVRSRRLHIGDVQRAVDSGSLDKLEPNEVFGALTIGVVADILQRKVDATRRANTIERYQIRLKDICRHFGASTPLTDVSTVKVEEYLHAVKGKRGQVWSANTQRSYKIAGQRLWSLAAELEQEQAGRIGRKARLILNPWKKAETPSIEQTRAEFLLPEEWRKVEEKMKGQPELAFVAVMCLAGLRIAEAIHLRTDVDVDLDERLIRVQSRSGEYAWRPKTKRSSRDIPISDGLHAILSYHREFYAGARFFFRKPKTDYPLKYRDASGWTRTSLEAAGIRYGAQKDALTAHSLRHTFASWLAQRGVNVLVIAKLIGDSVQMVVTVYGHLLRENLTEAIREIDEAVSEKKKRRV